VLDQATLGFLRQLAGWKGEFKKVCEIKKRAFICFTKATAMILEGSSLNSEVLPSLVREIGKIKHLQFFF